jgi:hypothetical protein
LGNILIFEDEGNIFGAKITDFATNRIMYCKNLINPQNYYLLAPEILINSPNIDYKKADLWNSGVLLGYLALLNPDN